MRALQPSDGGRVQMRAHRLGRKARLQIRALRPDAEAEPDACASTGSAARLQTVRSDRTAETESRCVRIDRKSRPECKCVRSDRTQPQMRARTGPEASPNACASTKRAKPDCKCV